MSNGNSNGHHRNGTANGVHKDTAIVARNGNGYKPDAAIVTEHDLLWDGLSPAVTKALGQPLDPSLVSTRKGRAGRTFSYIEGHTAIDQANRVFGFGGWGFELVENVSLRQIETVDTQTGEVIVVQRLHGAGAGHRARRAAPRRRRLPRRDGRDPRRA